MKFTIGDLVAANVLGLCEGGEIEVQMFNLALMLIKIPMLKFSTNAPLLQNLCYLLGFVLSFIFCQLKSHKQMNRLWLLIKMFF